MNLIDFKIIEQTICQMTEENDGILDLLPNLTNIARRAEVSMDILLEYFEVVFLNNITGDETNVY